MVKPDVLIDKTWDAVRKTINKFRENPYYFFTESDIHSYFYYCMYNSTFEVKRNNRRIYLVHREYPTNYRYYKKDLLKDGYIVKKPDEKIGGRGHYDMAVINPDFANAADNIDHIINKNINDAKSRYNGDIKNFDGELLFAIEFKYIISRSKNWVEQVEIDNKKLENARNYGAIETINLVFCNIDYSYTENRKKLFKEIINPNYNTNTILVESYYDGKDNKKITPKPLSNNPDVFNNHNIAATKEYSI
jgi:hypothetical protein